MPKGPQGQKRPADPNQLAKLIVDIAAGEVRDTVNPRGRAGGLGGGRARAEKLTPEARREIAKKVENHAAHVALHVMHYNFVRIHQTLRVTPAMAAGVTGRLWEIADLVAVLEQEEHIQTAG